MGFWGKGKTGVLYPGKKLSEQCREPTNSTHIMTLGLGIEPRSHCWEWNALNTVPSHTIKGMVFLENGMNFIWLVYFSPSCLTLHLNFHRTGKVPRLRVVTMVTVLLTFISQLSGRRLLISEQLVTVIIFELLVYGLFPGAVTFIYFIGKTLKQECLIDIKTLFFCPKLIIKTEDILNN